MIQASADDLRMAVAGQWLGGQPFTTLTARGADGAPIRAPLVICGVGTDTREELHGRLFVALRGERHDAHLFLADAAARGATAALVDRRTKDFARPTGLPLLEVADTRVALGDLASWWRTRLRGKVVAITGSSGKTTTRRLLHAALGAVMRGSASPKSFNNEIGVPLTLLGAAADDGYAVCEIGMSHPGEIAPLARMVAPHVAIVTMAGRAHLGGMGSVQAIIAEKASIVDGLNTNGVAIVNGDQPELVAAVSARAKPGVRVVPFGQSETCQWRLLARRTEPAHTMRVREPDGVEWECALGVPGDYNAMNALAAIAAARMLGVPATDIARVLPAVGPADMRMTRQPIDGIAVYNDAYNANPDAVLASLRAFAEVTGGASPSARRVTVLGDMLELGSPDTIAALHAEIGRAVAALAPAVAIFVGEGSAHGATAAREASRADAPGSTRAPGTLCTSSALGTSSAPGAQSAPGAPAPHVVHVASLDDAGVAAIMRLLHPGDAVLLKGSRGSRMERLIAALEARAERAGTPACSTT